MSTITVGLITVWCSTCGDDMPFDRPECGDDHGVDCPEWCCLECGEAVVMGFALDDPAVLGRPAPVGHPVPVGRVA